MYVNEAMTTAMLTCRTDTNLEQVARLMWEGDVGSIPVVSENNQPLGVVTDRDIAMAAMLNHQPLWEISAQKVIQNQQPCCCGQQETIESCLATMEQHGVRRILVTDEAGTLTGILSMGDALAFTSPDARRKSQKVNTEHMLGMLRKVSGHHEADQPVMRVG